MCQKSLKRNQAKTCESDRTSKMPRTVLDTNDTPDCDAGVDIELIV